MSSVQFVCNYFPNWLFVQIGIEIHACQISMGLDWMPSGGQSSSSRSSNNNTIVYNTTTIPLLTTNSINGRSRSVGQSCCRCLWIRSINSGEGFSQSVLLQLQMAMLCCHETIESQMVTSGVICGGPKLIINVFSLFTMIKQIVERTI